jgi:O-antigen ligase
MISAGLRQKLGGGGLSRLALVSRPFLRRNPTGWLVVQALALVLLVAILLPLLSGGMGMPLLLAPLAAMGAIWLIRQPHWGVLIILSLMFIELDSLFGVTYAVSAAIMIPLVWSIIRDRGCWLLRVPQIQILLLIGLLLLVSTSWSEIKFPVTLFPEKDQTMKQTREFITQLGWLVFFLYFINTRRLIELTAKLAVVLVAAAALSGLFLFVASGGADRAAAGFSLAKNSNRLAYISLFATSLVWFYRAYGPTHRFKGLTLPLLLCLPLTALTAGSRSGLLQIVMLGVLVFIDQKGWSPAKRVYCVLLIGVVALLIVAIVPGAYLERATRFDPEVDAPGQESLQNRVHVVMSALNMIAADPLFGAGFGNFTWVARAFFGSSGATHNSYLWATVSGGIGVLTLYLLLFFVTFRMLRRLEKEGPRELLWLSKGLRVNMVTFMIFSAFADFWLSDFLYLMVGMSIAMTRVWRHQEENSASLEARFAHGRDVASLRFARSER